MTALRVLIARLWAHARGRGREDVLDEEIAAHLELLAEEHRRRGLPEHQARLAARRDFGGVAQTREAFRDQRRLPSIDALVQDVRFAARALIRDRSTTVAAALLLTVGVGTTVVMADLLDRLLLRPPTHVDHPERVRRVYYLSDTGSSSALVSNYATIEALAAGTRSEVEWMAAFRNDRIGMGRGPDARRLEAVAHGEAYFDVLGLTPQLGVFPSARHRSGGDGVVISHPLWQQRFGGRPEVLGTPLRLGRRVYTIVAVAPRGFAGIDTEPVDVWVPLEGRVGQDDWRTSTGYYMLHAIARLRPGVDPTTADAHATQVFNAVHTIESDGGRGHYRIGFGPLPPAQKPGLNIEVRVLLSVAGVSALVLLIACGNVGNLLLVRGLRRAPELALKTALGATRGRLLREILLEASLLAVAAGAGALVVVQTVGTLVRRVVLPPVAATVVPLDGRMLVITLATCASAMLLLGLAPALRLTTRHALAPGRIGGGGRPSRLLDGFVALQVALSVPLIVGAGLFAFSFWHAREVDFGLETRRVAVVSSAFVDDGRPELAHDAHRRMQDALSRVPGVASVAMAQTIPMSGGMAMPFWIPGWTSFSGQAPFVNAVDPAFFDVMGVRFLQGRRFTDAENTTTSARVAIINEALAKRFFADRPALGSCIQVGYPFPPCAEIVGIVANTAVYWPDLQWRPDDTPPLILVPIDRFPDLTPDRHLLVGTRDHPNAILGELQRAAQSARGDLPYVDAWAVDDIVLPELRPYRLGAAIFVALSGLALVIAVAGLGVVTAHGVTRRTRELGIRLVLGADPDDLVRLMLRRSLLAVAAGLVVGGALAYAGRNLLRSFLFGTEPGDPRVFVGAALVLLVAGIVSTYVPARRAGRIEPADALRVE